MIIAILKFIEQMIVGPSGKIRIDPDHLPGLKAPKPGPPVPLRDTPTSSQPSGPTIEELYDRFTASGNQPPKRKRPGPRDGSLF